MLGYGVHRKRFWVVKWDVEAFMRCVFGDNDTPREQGAWALEVPIGGRTVIMPCTSEESCVVHNTPGGCLGHNPKQDSSGNLTVCLTVQQVKLKHCLYEPSA